MAQKVCFSASYPPRSLSSTRMALTNVCLLVYKTEPELGSAIKESGIDRSKLFVTTKVNQNIKDIQGAIKTSLKKLQLDYVDL